MIAFAVEDENYSDSNSNLTGASSADHYYVEGSPSEFDPIDPSKVTVNYILPLSNHENKGLMAIASLYAFLFMLGTCGNSAILAVVHHVKSTSKQARHNTTLTYICILSVVDFISMLPLPMTIVDQILGFWMFGTFACKVFRLFEHIGKVFSTFILVCFSIHRYCAVCHPLKVRLRNSKTAYVMLCVMFTLAFLLLCPILIFAQSKEIVAYESYDNTTNELTVLHLYKCVDDLSNELFVIFTLSCFLFAYLLPLLLMIYFYSGMILRLVHKTGIVRNSQFHKKHSGVPPLDDRIPVVQIAVYTLAICLFHIVCWTPYWASVIYSLYLELFYPPELQVPGTTFIYVMYGVHALPYINSASNFILYGLLNRQLHHSGVPPRIAAMPVVRTPSNPSSNVVSVRTDDKGRPSACVGALLSHGQSSSPQLHSDDGSDQRPILPHSNDSDDSRKSRLTVTRTNSIVGQKDSSNAVTILSNGLSTELLITSSDNNNDEVRL